MVVDLGLVGVTGIQSHRYRELFISSLLFYQQKDTDIHIQVASFSFLADRHHPWLIDSAVIESLIKTT